MAERKSTSALERAALLDCVLAANQEHGNRQSHLTTLNTKMAQLQSQVQAERNVVRATKIATLDAIHNFSKFESRLLADRISAKLPREIRDMIHSFCWDEKLAQYDHYKNERPWRASDVTQDELDGLETECSEYYCPPHPRAKALRSYPVHHFVHLAYVGHEAAREAAETFYRVAPAYIETFDTEDLECFFKYDDNFDLDIVPREHVTSITFLLDVWEAQSEARYYSVNVPNMCLDEEGIEAIFGPHPYRIHRITLLVKDRMPDMAIYTFQRSRDLYSQLKALGANVAVVYHYGSQYSGQKLAPVNLGDMMELPSCDWERHLVQECLKQDAGKNSWVEDHMKAVWANRALYGH